MVHHIMSDGRMLADIRGKVVREEDALAVYTLLSMINKKGGRERVNPHAPASKP